MSLIPRCSICDAPLDAYGRDGAVCKGHDMTTITNAMLEAGRAVLWGRFCPLIRRTPEDDEHYSALAQQTHLAMLAASPTNKEPSEADVAEAIHIARFPEGREPTPFADEDKQGREYCERLARAAITAMQREG